MAWVFNFLLFVLLVLLVHSSEAQNSGRCPPRSMVYSTKPVCQSDYDCPKGKVCCPNQVNTKSCAERSQYNSSSNQAQGGPGVYCGGVKCMPYEVCKPDPVTKKLKCQRG